MIRAFIKNRIAPSDRKLGVPNDYLRHMVETSMPVFMKFSKIFGPASYQKHLPTDAFHAARIVSAKHEDCGPCVQMAVNAAINDGVPLEVLRAIVDRDDTQLPPELVEVCAFTRHVCEATWQEGDLRERLRGRYGEAALIELSIAIALVRVFPVVKRAMGYGASCMKVKVELPPKAAN